MLKEFKEFISRGNVLDLAVGLILATYFGAIIKSLVNDVIMPPVGKAIGNVDFNDLKLVLSEATTNDAGEEVAEVAIMWGKFLNEIIVFILVAFAVFMVVKAYNSMKKKQEEAPAPDPGPTKDQELLMEIRDALKK